MPRWGQETPLVGRTDEVGRLAAAIDRARSGDPSAVLLAGDAGVGKTRLITDVARRAAADGVVVAVGHCVDFGDVGLPYLPFTEALTGLAHDGQGLATVVGQYPALARLLAADAISGVNTVGGGELGGQLQLFEAVFALLSETSQTAPILLILEDLHWADQSTRDLLRFMLSRLTNQRLVVLSSHRTDDLHRRHPLRPLLAELVRLPKVERLTLDPLPDGDVADLLSAIGRDLPGVPPPEVVRRIVERAEGNAFYAEELLEATVNSSQDSVPTGLADVLLARLEQLQPTALRVVRTAAVAGRKVHHALLRDAADLPEPELEEALRETVNHHVLVADSGDTYSFRHALLREATYGDLLPGERVRMHGAFARVLAQMGSTAGSAAELAYHARESNDLPAALTASLQAATEACRSGAPAEELRQYESALSLWSAVPDAPTLAGREEVSIILSAATAASQAGEMKRAVALTRSALDGVETNTHAELSARVRYMHARSLMDVDSDSAAYAEAKAALDLVPADPPSVTRMWAAATFVRSAMYTGDYDTARLVAAEVLESADAVDASAARADVMITLTRMGREAGDIEGPVAELTRALELAQKSGDSTIELRAAYLIASMYHDVADYPTALRWCDEAIDRARRTGVGWSAYPAEARFLAASIRYIVGDWDGSLRISNEAADRAPTSAAHVAASGLYVAVGRGDSTVEERLAVTREGTRDVALIAIVAGGCGADHLAWIGRPDAAVDLIRESSDTARKMWHPRFLAGARLNAIALSALADQADQARLRSDQATVDRLVADAQEFVDLTREILAQPSANRGRSSVEVQAWGVRVEAEWSRLSGPDPERWQAAVTAFDYGHVYEQARSRWRLAEALLGVDRRDDAAGEARAAYDVAMRLGARPLREAVESLARRGRLEIGVVPQLPTPETVLTPREREVLARLARGLTNRQIGRELFISEKTASVHVSNILGKLAVSGRAEAVAVAHQRGLLS